MICNLRKIMVRKKDDGSFLYLLPDSKEWRNAYNEDVLQHIAKTHLLVKGKKEYEQWRITQNANLCIEFQDAMVHYPLPVRLYNKIFHKEKDDEARQVFKSIKERAKDVNCGWQNVLEYNKDNILEFVNEQESL